MSEDSIAKNGNGQEREQAPKKKRKVLKIIIISLAVIAAGLLIAFKLINGAHVGTDNNLEKAVEGKSNVLVAYFSWSGNLRQMSAWVAEETGGETFRIVTQEPYSTEYLKCADMAKKEFDNGTRPPLKAHIPKEIFDKYDVIYLGFPIWWYDLPMPVWTFLEENDLSGKKVVPFFSHNGSTDGANSLNRVKELAKGAKVYAENAISVKDGDVASSEQLVKEWAADMLIKATKM